MKPCLLTAVYLLATINGLAQFYPGPTQGPLPAPVVTTLQIAKRPGRSQNIYSVPFFCGTVFNPQQTTTSNNAVDAIGAPPMSPGVYWTTVTIYSEQTTPVPLVLATKPQFSAVLGTPISASGLDVGKTVSQTLAANGSGAGATYGCNDIMALSVIPGEGEQFGDFLFGVIQGTFSIRTASSQEVDVAAHYTVLPLNGIPK